MFNRKTVLVVGAGASVEVGLPSGLQLVEEIARLLSIKFEDGQQVSGDLEIVEALMNGSRHKNRDCVGNIDAATQAAWRVVGGMKEALSIDNYLEAHADDQNVVLVGKLAIARSLLLAERNSLLWRDRDTPIGTIIDSTKNTWYHSLWQLLHQGITRSKVSEIFENFSIISFNYDRCIHQRIVLGLMNYYGLGESEAVAIAEGVPIIYPYGSLGPFNATAFGRSAELGSLAETASSLKVFSERIENQLCMDSIQGALSEADRIVFLGFSFNTQNMEILSIPQCNSSKRVLGTAFAIPPYNDSAIHASIKKTLGNNVDIVLDHNTCSKFFKNHWYDLIS